MPEVNANMLESSGVPLASRPTVASSCTCYIASGKDPGQTNPVVVQGHKNDKSQPLCMVHFPATTSQAQQTGNVQGTSINFGDGLDYESGVGKK